MTKVFVFGSFDGLHPGHEAFLQQAGQLGDELIVSVAQDLVIEKLKHRLPVEGLNARRAALEALPGVSRTVPGDLVMGTYAGFLQTRPDIVAFGYDQIELGKDFNRFQQATGDETPTVVLKPYQPEIYKSSLLRLSL